MNMTHFSLPQPPETQQESEKTGSRQTDVKRQCLEVLFNTWQKNIFWVLSQNLYFHFKERSKNSGYLVSLLKQLEIIERKEENTKERHTGNGSYQKGKSPEEKRRVKMTENSKPEQSGTI